MPVFIRQFVRPFHLCLEQSIFIFLAQIFKQLVRNQSAVSEHSESNQRAINEHSEHQNKSQYSRVPEPISTASCLISYRLSCSISDPFNKEVIITGGSAPSWRTVSVYRESGWQKDLAPLRQGRNQHACSHFTHAGEGVYNTFILHTYKQALRSSAQSKD